MESPVWEQGNEGQRATGRAKNYWNEEIVPKDWTARCCLAVLPKKRDFSLPSNYRGISIGESLSKVCATAITKHRLNDFYGPVVPECPRGFRRGRGRADSGGSHDTGVRRSGCVAWQNHGGLAPAAQGGVW
jgi:hypothetical protein